MILGCDQEYRERLQTTRSNGLSGGRLPANVRRLAEGKNPSAKLYVHSENVRQIDPVSGHAEENCAQ